MTWYKCVWNSLQTGFKNICFHVTEPKNSTNHTLPKRKKKKPQIQTNNLPQNQNQINPKKNVSKMKKWWMIPLFCFAFVSSFIFAY